MRNLRRAAAACLAAVLLALGAAPKYVPAADPAKDLERAQEAARRDGKRILLEVGGEWCVWCHILDRFFDEHPALSAFRDRNFVMLKVNYSPENRNREFLSRFPKVAGYPHIFVLDASGKLIRSQNTGELEEGRGYNLQKMTAFLEQHAAKK